MNKVYYIFIVLFFCSLALPVRGQKALDETIQKNVSLEKDLELLRKDSAKVKNSIKDMLLQIEKDSLKNKELSMRNNSLLSLTSQDSIIVLNQYVDSLENRHKSLQESILSITYSFLIFNLIFLIKLISSFSFSSVSSASGFSIAFLLYLNSI